MKALKITSKNFESEVLESDVPVLLDFWASWCGPCKMVSPIIEEVAKEKKDIIKVGKINIDEETELAKAFHIMSIPTLVVINEGKVVKTSIGLRPKKDILSLINFDNQVVTAAEEQGLNNSACNKKGMDTLEENKKNAKDDDLRKEDKNAKGNLEKEDEKTKAALEKEYEKTKATLEKEYEKTKATLEKEDRNAKGALEKENEKDKEVFKK